jgi:uncharacterized protein YecE (DUF72 family)
MSGDRRGVDLVGCSGFMYDDWRGVVYPSELPKSKWLEWYAGEFPTVELNGTFYKLPARATVAKWRERVAPEFTFCLKLGAFGTHRKKLRDPAGWLARHLDVFEPLGDQLGATLVQLPPRWRRNVERLDEFLALVPRHQRWAVEFRDPSWLHDDVFDVLRAHGAALCVHDLLADHPRILTTDWTYVRFHGPDALRHPYHGGYGRRRLAPTATWLDGLAERGIDAYVFFNNDYDGHAFRDAHQLERMLAGAPSRQTCRVLRKR